MSATNYLAQRKGSFPEWEVNIEGKIIKSRHKNVIGAISSALNKFPQLKDYEDLVIHVRISAGPDFNSVFAVWVDMWRQIGVRCVMKKKQEIELAEWEARRNRGFFDVTRDQFYYTVTFAGS